MAKLLSRIAKRLTDYDNPNSLGSKMRRKRLRNLVEVLKEIPARPVRVIDLGGRAEYWKLVAELVPDIRLDVTLVNIEEWPDDPELPWAHYVVADACNLEDYEDGAFDLAHSNSVIEHVGGWGEMRQFAQETSRVAARYFVQAPFFWFPVEPHCVAPFFHWMPRPLRAAVLRKLDLGYWVGRRSVEASIQTVDSARLPDRPMMRELFPDGELRNERVFWILTKSIIAIRKGEPVKVVTPAAPAAAAPATLAEPERVPEARR